MSHFTRVETQIRDLSLLNASAKALGLKKAERKTVNGYQGITNADVVWQVCPSYDVGAIKNPNGTYDLVADWWGTGMTIPKLEQKIPQEYALQVILRRAKLMGHQVSNKDLNQDGSVKIRIRTGV